MVQQREQDERKLTGQSATSLVSPGEFLWPREANVASPSSVSRISCCLISFGNQYQWLAVLSNPILLLPNGSHEKSG